MDEISEKLSNAMENVTKALNSCEKLEAMTVIYHKAEELFSAMEALEEEKR